MSCFSCGIPRTKESRRRTGELSGSRSLSRIVDSLEHDRASGSPDGKRSGGAHRFTLRVLAAATGHFKEVNLIGEGGFGRVFKGRLESGQIVAIKQLNREGLQGSREFLVEVLMLIMLHHPNLVSLIGYCSERNERLLVYEYMPHGSLEQHLFDLPPDKEPLEWNTRIKIAVGAAKGLTYLHDVADPPVIYRDLKSANILLDDEFNTKLSDFGLAKLGPVGDNTHVSTRVMGTYGYCAPDYAITGKLTVKSDVYSFGVVLLELITGRKAYEFSNKAEDGDLIVWSRPFLNNRRRFTQLADPLLQRRYLLRPFCQLCVIISMCLQEQPHSRPFMRDVASALNHVASQPYVSEADHKIHSTPRPWSPPPKAATAEEDGNKGYASSQ